MKGNSHKLFKTVSELSSKKKKPSTPVILDKQGNDINDAKRKLERWKEYFEEKLNPEVMTDPNVLNSFPIIDRDPPPPPHRSETKAAIESLKRGKAPGPDGVTAELINVGSEDVVDLYHSLISATWSTGHVPQQWCKAAIVPKHKARRKNVTTTGPSASQATKPES